MSSDPTSVRGMSRDVLRLMELIDKGTDTGGWTDELEGGLDVIAYDDDPVRQWERRVRESEVAALGAIAFLLLRQDEEMWEAWERY
jgi:hypothetical protein